MWFYEFLVLTKYTWLFFWRGGAEANMYLKYADAELARIKGPKPPEAKP